MRFPKLNYMRASVGQMDSVLSVSESVGVGEDSYPREKTESLLSLQYLPLLACVALAVALVGFFILVVTPLVTLPADILMWEETNFVGDMIKLRIGAPLYTAPADSNSFIYNPLAPLLTYAISWLTGRPISIAGLRLIQLGFVACSAILATRCSLMLRRWADPERRLAFPKTWLVFTFLTLFLAATAPEVNRYVYCLHVDALALLVSIFSFWTMLRYVKKPSWQGVVLMAICPAIGYLTKQFLFSWTAVMLVFLVLHNYKNIKRPLLFGVLAAAFIAVGIGACYLLWGDPYIFWTFKVMGARKQIVLWADSPNISLLRMLDHSLRAWLEILIGVVGGVLLLRYRRENIRQLGPLWIAWLTLIASEAFSSGAGWNTVYHFGPGVLIGAVWLLAALPLYWPTKSNPGSATEFPKLAYWTRTLFAVAGVITVMVALHVVPSGDSNSARYRGRLRFPPDVNRYLSAIQSEFDGLPADRVLLDIGNWVYLPDSVLQKNRAISLADQTPSGNYENMDIFVADIRKRVYSKILVHDLHSPFFIYDWKDWPKSSGVRQALLENYQEVRTIPAVERKELLPPSAYTGPVSVLVPR